jgi:hypothetical protein
MASMQVYGWTIELYGLLELNELAFERRFVLISRREMLAFLFTILLCL